MLSPESALSETYKKKIINKQNEKINNEMKNTVCTMFQKLNVIIYFHKETDLEF